MTILFFHQSVVFMLVSQQTRLLELVPDVLQSSQQGKLISMMKHTLLPIHRRKNYFILFQSTVRGKFCTSCEQGATQKFKCQLRGVIWTLA
jgi:hypothetical protein